MRQLQLVMIALMLIGCQPKSEVDKCVEAIHKVNEPYTDADDRNFSEMNARLFCLRKQAGK